MRRFWIRLHLWLGLTVGLFWAMQGLTGALLVFHRELDRVGGAALTDGPMLPPDRLITIASAHSGAVIQRLNANGDNERLIEARYNDGKGRAQAVLMDAASGRIVGERDRYPDTPFTGSAWRWIMRLHVALTVGDMGELAMGLSGVFLLLSAGVGLYLGWPRRRMWRAVFSPGKWKAKPQQYYGWHRATGLLSGVAIIIFTVSGCYMVFAMTLGPMMGISAPYDAIVQKHHSDHDTEHASHDMTMLSAISPDQALEKAQKVFPDGRFVALETPNEHPRHYLVRFRIPGEWRSWAGRATLLVDAQEGTEIARYDPSHASFGHWLDDVAYPLHTGEAMGLAGRILTVFAGLTLPSLFFIGCALWIRKRRVKRSHRA